MEGVVSQRIPAEVFPVGDFLKEEMDARGWSQADLAKIIGRSDRDVHALVRGKLALRPETATLLGDAFGTAPEYWMNLDTAYRAWTTSRDTRNAVSRKGQLYELAPVRGMQKRGWIPATENIDALERHVFEFFQVDGIDSLRETLPFAARASVDAPTNHASVRAWIARVRNLAASVMVTRSFSDAAFADCLSRLRLLLAEPMEARHVPRTLAEHGIRFVVVEHLQKSRIDGACIWLDKHSPVIALSMRYERMDWFWFTLLHEMQHVRARDGQEAGAVTDDDLVGRDAKDFKAKPAHEQAADQFAADFLVPQSEIEDFSARVRPLFSKARITSFAKRIAVHPSLVVGQLQFRGEIPYYHSRAMLKDKIRRIVQANALTDGWQ